MRRRDAGTIATTIALVVALTACGGGPEPHATSTGPATGPTGTVEPAPTATEPATSTPPASATPLPGSPETVVEGLDAPWSMVALDGSVLVSERDSGRIVELTPDGTLREAGVVDGVVHGGEGGLLGLAVHEGALFVYATASGGNRVDRYDLQGGPGSWTLGGHATVVEGLPAASNHNAGRIAFGPDGRLYVPVGDAGDRGAAQDPTALGGKILRLEPDGSVPADNPTPGSPVYSLGHRNVQGLAWDGEGRLFASEFGQNTWDELNIIVAGGNYGWPVVEGIGGGDFVDPVAQWPTQDASPSGIAVVDGVVLMANLRGEVLRAVSTDDPSAQREHFAGEFGRLRDVFTGPDGAVWFLTNNTDGRGSPRPDDDRILRVAPDAVGL